MAVIGNLIIGMSAKTGQFVKGLKEASKELGSFSMQVTQAASKLSGLNFAKALPALAKFSSGVRGVVGSLTSVQSLVVGMGVVAGAGALAAGWVSAAGAASDLNEQVSKASTVFGDAVSIVSKGAQQMGDDFGYPKKEFYDAASSIGLIAKASGMTQAEAANLGTDFARLAADAASFYNVPLEEGLGAIRSGLVGEAEPMRRFGVLLSSAAVEAKAAELGFKKVNGAYTEGAKVQARAQLISAGLADAQGDLARTAGSAANQVRSVFGRIENLQADFGTAIQPITDQILILANSAVKVLGQELTANSDEFKAWAQGAGASGGLISEGFLAIGNVIGGFIDLIQYAIGAWDVFQAALVKTSSLMAQAIFHGFIEPWTKFIDMIPGVDGAIGNLVNTFTSEMDRVAGESWAHAGDMFTGQGAGSQINAYFGKVAAEAAKATQAMNAAADASKNIGKGATSATPGVKDLSDKIATLEKDLKSQVDMFGKSGSQAAIYKLQLAGATKEQLAQVQALADQKDKLEAAKKAFEKDKEAAKKFSEDARTPLQEYNDKLTKLKDLLAKGLITKESFGQASLKAKGEFEKDAAPGKSYSAAMELGSKEARSTILNYRGADAATATAEPAKQAVKLATKQVDLQTKMVDALTKIADKAADATLSGANSLLGMLDFS